jgi:hypothetical protein
VKRRAGLIRFTATLGLAVAAALALSATGCRGVGAAFGSLGGSAAAKADDFFGALALRFGEADRDSRFAAIRPQLVRHALSPSRIYADTSIWTSRTAESRTVSIAGALTNGRYVLAAQPSVPPPAKAGDSRHLMHLRRISDGVYRWDSTDEVAVGTVRAEEVFAVLRQALRGTERAGPILRADYPLALPRTTEVLGRLFSLDTLITLSASDGSRIVSLSARADPKRMHPSAPLYADYLEEYLSPLRIELTLIDAEGRSWGSASFRDNTLKLRFRSQDGELRSLVVPPGTTDRARDATDSLRLRISFFAKVLFFNVGTSELLADVVPVRSDGLRGWSVRFRKEPRWHFPLGANNLVRATLRRPFAGDGTMIEYAVRETASGQTVLERNIRITVEESAIVRWIGSLGATAVSDLTITAEQEKDRYIADIFRALGADIAGEIR